MTPIIEFGGFSITIRELASIKAKIVVKKLFLIILLFISINNCFSQIIEENVRAKSFPKISNYVNDFEDILRPSQENILKSSVESFEKESNFKIIIVTVDSIQPFENIYSYSLALANQIQFRSDVVIVICNNLRQIQIQNNDRILDKITNEETKKIIENYILPEFKKDKYFKGLLKGIVEIKKELN